MNASLFLEYIDKYFRLVVGKITEKFNDAKQEQPADEGLLSYTKKLCLFFKKHPPGELHNQKML